MNLYPQTRMSTLKNTLYSSLQSIRHHTPLKSLDPLWAIGRKAYREVLKQTPLGDIPISKNLGGVGSFQIDPYFAFSDLENWGSRHNHLFQKWVDACKDKHTVLDIGGHVGWYALPAAQVLAPDGKLIIFEPADANLRLLKRHLSWNHLHNTEIHQILIGNQIQNEVPFYEMDIETGVNSIVVKKQQSQTTTRPMTTLDTFCQEHQIAPEVMKIDIEGAELQLFEGAKKTLQAARPLIFLSVHPGHLKKLGESTETLFLLIQELGYDVYNAENERVQTLEFDEYLLQPQS